MADAYNAVSYASANDVITAIKAVPTDKLVQVVPFKESSFTKFLVITKV